MAETEIRSVSGQIQVRAERFQSSLQPRVIRSAGIQKSQSFRAVLLERGRAVFASEGGEQELAAPLVAWFPWAADMSLRLGAGSQGVHLLLEPQSLTQALRYNIDDAPLAFMAERPALLDLSGEPELAEGAIGCFRSILSETSKPQRMSFSVINAHLGVLLIYLFRGQSAGGLSDDQPLQRPLASRFVTLVETHYRDHWKLERYASALGISRDRLNDVCQRAYARPPAVLVRSRIMLEAKRLLDNTALSVDQIAGILGYSNASQFNRFFRAQEGVPPGRFRSEQRRAARNEPTVPAAPYEWP